VPRIPDIDERLAAYVDGTLEPSDRAELERLLDSSPELREQVEFARTARDALRALPEEDVPPGTLQPVVRELDRIAAGGSTTDEAGIAPEWSAGTPVRARSSRWSIVAAAAAASIVVLAAIVVVPNLDDTDAGSANDTRASEISEAGDAEGAAPVDRPPVLERSSQDFDTEALQALAAQTTRDPIADGPVPSAKELQTFAPAIECVREWESATNGGSALRVIEATFDGTPAYVGVFRDDTPPAKVIVWAVKRKGCDVLAVTSDQL
jgi:hypothetical protein